MEKIVGSRSLSAREQQVLELLVLGSSYQEISGRLSLSYATVHTHIRHIYKKFQVRSRGQAVAKFLIQRVAKGNVILLEPVPDNNNAPATSDHETNGRN
jgi:DNA-binding CsgD family transcriptional regulator